MNMIDNKLSNAWNTLKFKTRKLTRRTIDRLDYYTEFGKFLYERRIRLMSEYENHKQSDKNIDNIVSYLNRTDIYLRNNHNLTLKEWDEKNLSLLNHEVKKTPIDLSEKFGDADDSKK